MFGHQRVQILENGSVGWGPDLRLAPAATSLPQGYNSTMAIYGGAGGVNGVVHDWQIRELDFIHKERDDELVVSGARR